MSSADHMITGPPAHNVCVCVCAVFRDFAFVAGDKDSCVLKCHVFRCNAPAKAIATALHEMCSKVSESVAPSAHLSMFASHSHLRLIIKLNV